MKTNTTPALALSFLLFACCLGLPSLGLAQQPLLAEATFTAITGKEAPQAGRPVRLVFDLKGHALATGAYAAVNLDFPERPEGERPKVRPGYPETVVVFAVPGSYLVHATLHEVVKPSCGGVEAKKLLDAQIRLEIMP
ncbi:MAG: hypothetical protein AB7D51_08925 [Desulfovibrionaceae bacterium]